MSKIRRMDDRWWIHVCPECNGLVGERSQAHNETCPYRGGDAMFVPLAVEVVSAVESDSLREQTTSAGFLRQAVRERLARIEDGNYSVVEMAADLEKLLAVQWSGKCYREGCQAGDLAALREAAQAVVDAYRAPVLTGKLYPTIRALRAVLASADSEEER